MTAPLTIISSMATRRLLTDLAAQFERRIGTARVSIESVGGVDAARRVRAGEAFDVVVLAGNAIDALIAAGNVVADSRVDLVHSGVAVAVRAGAPRPDIGSGDAVRQSVLDARSIGYSTGPSGTQLLALFERWGIMNRLRGRLVQAPPGVSVGSLIAQRKIELGFQQLSELMDLPEIDVIGPLPDAIQIMTTFAAGRAAASIRPAAVHTLLRFLTSAEADDAKRRQGMDPA